MRSALTDNVLDDDLDCPEGHVTARHLVRRPCPPFIRRYRLQEVLNGGEQLDRVKRCLLQVQGNIPGQLPHTLQDKLCDLGLLRIWRSLITGERLHDLK